MLISSSVKYVSGVIISVALLAGCSTGSPSAFNPSSNVNPGRTALRPNPLPPTMLYVSAGYYGTVFGYSSPRNGHANKKNGPAACTFSPSAKLDSIDADAKGHLIVPNGEAEAIEVYAPDCGALEGSVYDYYGSPHDAATASANALTGKIVVASDSEYAESVTVCTIKAGCTTNLPIDIQYGTAASVAVSSDGDCWAESEMNYGLVALSYFKGCSGSAQTATGFENTGGYGLDIDKSGNILAVDEKSSLLYVYSGCNPACTLVGGPFAMHGGEYYGHLDKAGKTFAAVNYFSPQVNIYSYTPSSLTYLYSFNNGLSSCVDCTGVAFAPAIKN
jgi:hypothetical protein